MECTCHTCVTWRRVRWSERYSMAVRWSRDVRNILYFVLPFLPLKLHLSLDSTATTITISLHCQQCLPFGREQKAPPERPRLYPAMTSSTSETTTSKRQSPSLSLVDTSNMVSDHSPNQARPEQFPLTSATLALKSNGTAVRFRHSILTRQAHFRSNIG